MNRRLRQMVHHGFFAVLAGVLAFSFGACDSSSTSDDEEDDGGGGGFTESDRENGGQLYDKWVTITGTEQPTTMTDSTGATISDDDGHNFRCKNCHGWDYRGAEGVYGPNYQNKAYVAAVNLFEEGTEHAADGTEDDLVTAITNGGIGMPAFGSVLTAAQINDLVTFLVNLYDPADIFTLDATAGGKGYVLNSGADTANGDTLFAASCDTCHGADGTTLLVDDNEHTNASLARQAAYEIHHKIANGQPGSTMGEQYTSAGDILDLLAAMCDGGTYPNPDDATHVDATAAAIGCGEYYVAP